MRLKFKPTGTIETRIEIDLPPGPTCTNLDSASPNVSFDFQLRSIEGGHLPLWRSDRITGDAVNDIVLSLL